MGRVKYARISLTPRCPLRCRYCVGEGEVPGVGAGRILLYDEILLLIDILKDAGVEKFRFTGGEPFLREGVMEFFENINLENWGVTTSLSLEGIGEEVRNATVENINVSLDTLCRKKYSSITRGGSLMAVLDNLEKIKDKNVKLNTILIKDFNEDEVENIIEYAHGRGFIPRFIEKMDLSFSPRPVNLKSAPVDFIRRKLIEKGLLEKSFRRENNSAALYHRSSSGSGQIGFITPLSNPFCHTCDRIRITADGLLKSCLFSGPEAFIAPALKTGREEAEKVFKNFISLKTSRRKGLGKRVRMSAVGG